VTAGEPGPPGLTLEVAGLPGSGKSRLVRSLTAALTERGLAVRQPQACYSPTVPTAERLSRKALACARVGTRSPVATARLARALLRSGQPGAGDLAGRMVQLLVAQSAVRRSRPAGVDILDEGVVQSLWSVGLRGDVRPALEALAHPGAWPTADLLVVLAVAPELAAERLRSRRSRHSRLQELPDDELLAATRSGQKRLDELVEWWTTRPGVPGELFVVNGAEEDGDDRHRLAQRVVELAERAR
jgi:thymidylate kinase